ncbi:MAG: transglutaminase family protein [bacterium]
MAIRVALHHRTRYRYDRRVRLGPQIIRLRPAPHSPIAIPSYSLRIRPEQHFLNWQQDPQGNFLARVVVPEPTTELEIDVDLTADILAINPFDFFLEPESEKYPFRYEPWLAKELAPFLEVQPPGPRLTRWLATVDRGTQGIVDMLVALNQRLSHDVRYVIRMEPGVQSCEETLSLATGSCRDSAWLLVQILRNLGLAARFASGYLIQLVADEKPLEGPAGPTHDFTDLHAWAEVYLPGGGWIGLDPTSGLFAGEGHIPLACTPDPVSAAPISGLVDECEVEFEHTMAVSRIHEDPRVTKPYSDDQWQAIEALGHRVDGDLDALDVRLTMGGEPTFVSIDDMEGEEWNTTALGPTKRLLAGELVHRLRERFAPGALLHFGQGKWYPGESLPRWALGCWWRRDGLPVWRNPALIADERLDLGHGDAEAKRFVTALAERLNVDARFAIPGYEDTWYWLWRERRLPVNVDPHDSRLDDAEERARMARVFEHGLGKPVGYALPLTRLGGPEGLRWASGPWFVRAERLYLIPGDSPMGYRLPLDSLPWIAESARDAWVPLDPFTPLPALPVPPGLQPLAPPRRPTSAARVTLQRDGGARRATEPEPPWRPFQPEAGTWVIRTAVCIEPRNGRLHVFMPPIRITEDYLELVTAIEDTAAALALPVVVEGYKPPGDPRLASLEVTPDPGVIEVNVQPARSWDELCRIVTGLYEDARLSRLGTEKFMLDGRHTGTGGGNHVVLGGPTVGESPFLRRPDLLRSLVGYWLNHPSLSYVFSGLFIGPTSQAPRIDEARNDAIHELELAFREIPEPGEEPCPPWLVDRVLRNLLTDVTGNTHRTEFCIDKLYSPDGVDARRGLVEMRAFEMPPHARMSLAQQLLLRALVARFWREPYRAPLVRWGTTLHDRFLLPYFVDQDFRDVLEELALAGYPFERAWYDPHFEFRFPVLGTVAHRGVSLELRQAIEPWHVLGEEAGGGGTVRYVDSSVERVQVLVRGMTDPRHAVTVNGHALPLHPTGAAGEFVAGVRYRAWQPPACLHPTIPVDSPLTFDLVDTWLGRSLGGCVYYVSHPGGRSYDVFPVNARESEARRATRFARINHTPGVLRPTSLPPGIEHPLTLDLRR